MGIGASKAEVCAEIGIHRDTLHDWCNSDSPRYNQDISDAIKEGMQLSQGWWERQGRENIDNNYFNSTLYIFNMKNRFKDDWADISRKELSGPDGGAIPVRAENDLSRFTDEQLDQLEALLNGVSG